MMQVKGLNHITINVVDLQESVGFYKTILNLEDAGFIDMEDHTLTYFNLPQGVRLELINYMEKGEKKKAKGTERGMYRHFCLEVDSLEEFRKICFQKGVFIRKEPSYVEKLSCSTMLITDPNGVEIEIIEK